ncbi:multifunctional 2',3'-cyclic-nucleotide 2'-phosphodiesterase/5'-nucleotidase/3'-nucleotidase [Paenibacillus kribbensis]|uniref:Multifunctional 2',3'-cyclic-nucleotide 2'-phosphodiesterase/5'-nucleotidase/3'-nucleotidase n=1 Tax=Paenibacillus kribbensis TaxID=172713 RepID=A0A222WS28_9BACL|nr:5'-nucleotidase C-terminal domain-containing protein [Paenibacillus kribbensis]ASR48722.1 multifunctional 2',3'-cyclic-nucleotide 2'-phosphodiesterase/5'-nucleotidase/3'-nucleotidase [Paenibacillus kribbensis]
MNSWKKISSLLTTAALLFGCLGTAAADPAANAGTANAATAPTSGKHITILHTNDTHAHVVANDKEMGFAKLAGIIDQYRASNPNTLLLDDGDTIHGTTFATLVNGESIVKVINKLRYDAMVPGNHEFNYGWKHLVELSKEIQFPVLSANIKQTDGTRLFKPYVIKEVDGVKIGIIGLTTPETAYKTNPKNVEGIQFTDPAAEAKAAVDEIRSKVDVVVVLGHLGQDASSKDTSLKVVKEVPGIDIFIDGHSHTVLEKGLVGDNGTLIASAGEYTKYLGVVDLWVDGGKVIQKQAKLIDSAQAADVQPNAEIATLIASIQKDQEPILKQVVTQTSVDLEGAREKVRAGETNLGDLLTDAMRDVSGADVALTNGGGIRASIKAGTVTKGDIITVLPFGNQIVTLKVKGSDIQAALENGIAAYPEPSGGFPQVSGITFKIDTSAAKGSRVHSILIGGKALDPEATYTLATNDFTAVGGDQYTMFAKYPQAGMFGSLDEALIRYMQKIGSASLQAQADGRIQEAKADGNASVPATQPAPTATPAPVQEKPQAVSTPAAKPVPAKPAPVKSVPAKTPAAKPQQASASAQAANSHVYVVKSGDTLYDISRKHGTTWQQLQKLNKLKNPHRIYPGQKLNLPA